MPMTPERPGDAIFLTCTITVHVNILPISFFRMKIHPPRSGTALIIQERGRLKYGWYWLRCETGDWFGSKSHVECILQVRDLSPTYPTQKWRSTFGGHYIATDEWEPIDHFIAGAGRSRDRG